MIGEAIYIRVSDRKSNLIATKRGNVSTQELQRQIRCFLYVELSDVPRLQQVEKKAVGRQRNLGLASHLYLYYQYASISELFMV
jgi:hypothetical protein